MSMNKSTINVNGIRKLFKEEYEEYDEKSTEKEFDKFLQFLEIDLRDWVRENVREFYRQK